MSFPSRPISDRHRSSPSGQVHNSIESLEPRRLLAAPSADVGGPYEIFEGQQLDLNASGSDDADDDIASYIWTINGQELAPETEPELTVTWGELQDMGLGDGTQAYSISVRVIDLTAQESTDSSTLTIRNAPPEGRISVTPPSGGFKEGATVTINSFVHFDWNAPVGASYDYETKIWLDGNLVHTRNATTTSSAGDLFQYQLPDDGTLEVRTTITDTEGASALATVGSGGPDVFTTAVASVPISLVGSQINAGGAAEGTPFNAAALAQAASVDTITYEWWLERQVGTEFIAEPSVFGGQVQLTPRNDGTYRVRLKVDDGDSPIVFHTLPFPVTNGAPTAAIVSAPEVVDYTGHTVTIIGAASDPGVDDTFTYLWTLNGQALPSSSSPVLEFTATQVGTNTYSLVVVDDSGAASAPVGGTFEVVAAAELASIAYSGALHFTTSSAEDTTADVTLRATLNDGDGGDISRAAVTFFNIETDEIYASGVPVTAMNDGSGTGFAAHTFSAALSVDPEFLHIGVRIDSGGAYQPLEAQALISLSTPAQARIRAGGSIMASDSGGLFDAAPGTEILFSVNSRTHPQNGQIAGGVELVFSSYRKADGTLDTQLHSYLVSSTDVAAVSAWTDDGVTRASLGVQVDVWETTGLKKKDYVLVYSGLLLEMNLTDGGKQGLGDSLCVTVWSSGCDQLLFASNWNGSSATEDFLFSGDVDIALA